MRTTIALGLGCTLLLGGTLLGGCLRNWEGYGHDVGEPCDGDDECVSGSCVPDDTGTPVCTFSCDGTTGCLPGWSCEDDGTCSCAGGASEGCNALDDDCDGAIDEDGACGCSGPELCNMIDDDCDDRVDEAGCGTCVPRVEGCNAIDDDCDGLVDEEPSGSALCRRGFECSAGSCQCSAELHPPADELDLLFVIDNSVSMREEQASLVRELPRMLTVLGSGDRDGDGMQDFEPARSVHIGVITTDMGTGGFPVPTCDRGTFGAMFGDDGILSTRGDTSVAGCMASYPSVLEFASGETDPAQLAAEVACVATAGTNGCGMEQQLEATLKALSPSSPQAWTIPGYVPPIFLASTTGHADGANVGFVRPDSALAIVMITDEEDCSVWNPAIFDATSTAFPGDLGLRCWMYENESAHPIDRFVRGEGGHGGLLGLRRRPDRLIFTVIAGVPLDAVPDPATPDFAAVLAHEGMQNVIEPGEPTTPRLREACESMTRGRALPARRIVQVAQGLDAQGARVSLGSICEESFVEPFDALLADVADSFTASTDCR